MRVEVPGETDAAVQLRAIRRDEREGLGGLRLGKHCPEIGVRLARFYALDAVRDELVHHGELRNEIRGAMLERLESRDRLAKLLARFHVGDGALGDRPRRARTIRGD